MHATTAAAGVPFRDRPNQKKMTQIERVKALMREMEVSSHFLLLLIVIKGTKQED